MNLLLALRIFGPIAVVSFAERLGRPSVQVDWKLWALENQGLAAHPTSTSGTWSVTPAGCRMVDRHEVESVSAVARDGARACVGVSQA